MGCKGSKAAEPAANPGPPAKPPVPTATAPSSNTSSSTVAAAKPADGSTADASAADKKHDFLPEDYKPKRKGSGMCGDLMHHQATVRKSMGHVQRKSARTLGQELAMKSQHILEEDIMDVLKQASGLQSTDTETECAFIGTETDADVKETFKEKPVSDEGDLSRVDASSIGRCCKKGLKECGNQDSYFVARLPDLSLYCVLDGHGLDGHLISDYAKEVLLRLIVKDVDLASPDRREEVIKKCFLATHSMIKLASEEGLFCALLSGTTCTLVLHDHIRATLMVAHVGDSGCAIAKKKDGNDQEKMKGVEKAKDQSKEEEKAPDEGKKEEMTKEEEAEANDKSEAKEEVKGNNDEKTNDAHKGKGPVPLTAQMLTTDHTCDIEAEAAYISEHKGLFLKDGCGNYRIFALGKKHEGLFYPGINMTRALGDLLGHADCGLRAEPQVTEVRLGEGDSLLLLCSDGVWTFLDCQKAVDAVSGAPSAQEGADALAEMASDAWKANDKDTIDDITVIAVKLDETQTFQGIPRMHNFELLHCGIAERTWADRAETADVIVDDILDFNTPGSKRSSKNSKKDADAGENTDQPSDGVKPDAGSDARRVTFFQDGEQAATNKDGEAKDEEQTADKTSSKDAEKADSADKATEKDTGDSAEAGTDGKAGADESSGKKDSEGKEGTDATDTTDAAPKDSATDVTADAGAAQDKKDDAKTQNAEKDEKVGAKPDDKPADKASEQLKKDDEAPDDCTKLGVTPADAGHTDKEQTMDAAKTAEEAKDVPKSNGQAAADKDSDKKENDDKPKT